MTNQTPARNRLRRRILVWIACAFVLIGGTLFYIYFWLVHPIGSGPAGPAVDAESFQKVWTEQEVVLLGFGDSITAGFGASAGKSYFQRLLKNPPDEFPDLQGINLTKVMPRIQGVNLALSGSTSLEMVDILIQKIENYPETTYGVVVASIGGNDVIHLYGRTPPREGAMYGATMEQAEPWVTNFEERLNLLLDQLGEHFPGGYHIFLCNIYDPTDGIGDTFNAGLPAWPDGLKVLGAYNNVIHQVCEQRDDTTLIDIHSEFMGHGIHSTQFWRSFYDAQDPGYWYYDNLEDPNDRGYDAIRRLMLNQMASTLPARLREGTQERHQLAP